MTPRARAFVGVAIAMLVFAAMLALIASGGVALVLVLLGDHGFHWVNVYFTCLGACAIVVGTLGLMPAQPWLLRFAAWVRRRAMEGRDG